MQLFEQYTVVGVVITELKNIVHMGSHLHADTFIYDIPNLRTFSYQSTRNCSNFMVTFLFRSKVFGVFSAEPTNRIPGYVFIRFPFHL